MALGGVKIISYHTNWFFGLPPHFLLTSPCFGYRSCYNTVMIVILGMVGRCFEWPKGPFKDACLGHSASIRGSSSPTRPAQPHSLFLIFHGTVLSACIIPYRTRNRKTFPNPTTITYHVQNSALVFILFYFYIYFAQISVQYCIMQ